jgi:hypothetical protein
MTMPVESVVRSPRLVALALLALLAPPATAGPPEGVSGRMVPDEVADGLMRHRLETDQAKRRRWLKRLALTTDPRVAIALAEAMSGPDYFAASLFCKQYVPDASPLPGNAASRSRRVVGGARGRPAPPGQRNSPAERSA